MAQPIISVRNLGKKYRLGITHGSRNYKALRDTMAKAIRSPLGFLSKSQKNDDKTFWALKDISFDVQQGEVLGIIGRNGAGKSTLLKILSQITEPTEGEVRIRGRVGSLLEVGTGFHPELTGRENIYMNGAILGMTRAEIKRKFDEIVAFAEVEKFIDTPVKRYSSGMYVRLAFAVAAHLEPEILLIDEVLAVGDAAFQKKCLGKMGDVAKEGRTVLFVSHNMAAIRQLVTKCCMLVIGKIHFMGDADECINQYLQSTFNRDGGVKNYVDTIPSNKCPVVVKKAMLKNIKNECTEKFVFGGHWCLELLLEAIKPETKFQSSLQIYNEYGVAIYHLVCRDSGQEYFTSSSSNVLRITLPKLMLYPGQYFINIVLMYPGWSSIPFSVIEGALNFSVSQAAGFDLIRPLGPGKAVVHEQATWELLNQ